ncbi:MAG TPA: hypothetical protein VLN58_03465 [Verrucomicrobiae bacterium]|nr:hypothetical protein [Verrucomicrobiae bacterium]
MPYRKFTLQNYFYLLPALRLTELTAEKRKIKRLNEEQQVSCVLGAVTASVAFLECSINGLFAHAASRIGRQTNYRKLLSSLYHDKLKFANLPWLTKYQAALALAHKPVFELGKEPYQAADLLNQLRNELMHPKEIFAGVDAWSNVPFGTKLEKTSLEKRLTGRFKFNAAEKDEEFIPHLCLSPDCAYWAVETAAKFYIEFDSRLPTTAYFHGSLRQHAHEMLAELRKLKFSEKKGSV